MEQEKVQRPLQWHPAFYANLQIELEAVKENLTYENEHQLGTKPMAIDVLVIKKQTELPIRKNIGRIFRRYNVIEYKSPEDYIGINDFYKVFAYAYLYKSQRNIGIGEMTITLACSRYPKKLLQYLQKEKDLEITKTEEGIYYIKGWDIPVQLILLHQLSREKNLWLRSIGGRLSGWQEAEELIQEYKKHKKDERYRSVMDLIVRVNRDLFLEVKHMCQALEELMADELEAMRQSGWAEGEKYGWSRGEKHGWSKGEKHGRSEGEKIGRLEERRHVIHSFAELSKILLQQNRQKDLLRALEDEQYLEQLFQEYHI